MVEETKDKMSGDSSQPVHKKEVIVHPVRVFPFKKKMEEFQKKRDDKKVKKIKITWSKIRSKIKIMNFANLVHKKSSFISRSINKKVFTKLVKINI